MKQLELEFYPVEECFECGGEGWVEADFPVDTLTHTSGFEDRQFTGVRLMCGMCQGTGKLLNLKTKKEPR